MRFLLFFFPLCLDAALKVIEPQWATKVMDTYPEGGVSEVLLYDRNQSQELAEKLIHYYPGGTVLAEVDLLQQPISAEPVAHGSAVRYYKDGTIETYENYVQGKREGQFEWFYPNEQLYRKQLFKDDREDGPYAMYDEEGHLLEQGHYKNGQPQGERMVYYPSGQKKEALTFVNGLLHGRCTSWYENGSVQEVKFYLQGMLHGQKGKNGYTKYYPDQKVECAIEYTFGKPNGLLVEYHPNGKEKHKVAYVLGQKEGKECFWAADGTLIGEKEFVNGSPRGRHYMLSQDGATTIYSATYDANGQLTAPIKEVAKEYSLKK